MELFILTNSKNSFPSTDYNWINCPDSNISFAYKIERNNWQCWNKREEQSYIFTSEKAICRRGSNFEFNTAINNLETTLPSIQNNIIGIEFNCVGSDFQLVSNSARFSRARMYYTITETSILFSHDLRKLIPYSNKKVNPAAAYSILKYGDVPEHLTIVEGISTIPVSQFIKLNTNDFTKTIKQSQINSSCFDHYFHLSFPMDGGDLQKTEQLLESQYQLIAQMKPLIPVSGGVDSTLINFLVDKYSDEKYPAFTMQFGDDDPEINFTKKAVEGTKAQLHIENMSAEDFIPSFEFQTEKLIQPVGESSAIAFGYMVKQAKFEERYLVDGTTADGCYGSKDYTKPLFGGHKPWPHSIQRLNEHISAFMQFHDIKGHERFTPRDSFMPDEYMQFMHMYLGPFANTWIRDAQKYSNQILPYWLEYYKMIDTPLDEWSKFSIFKMVNYASKTTTAKSYDNLRPQNSTSSPFMWLDILEDQGHYSWEEKTKNGIIKYPLKKILEKHISKDFIYRKKVGLNSSFEDWIHTTKNQSFLIEILENSGGISDFFMGKSRKEKLIKKFQKGKLHPNLSRLIINLAIQEAWLEKNKISIG